MCVCVCKSLCIAFLLKLFTFRWECEKRMNKKNEAATLKVRKIKVAERWSDNPRRKGAWNCKRCHEWKMILNKDEVEPSKPVENRRHHRRHFFLFSCTRTMPTILAQIIMREVRAHCAIDTHIRSTFNMKCRKKCQAKSVSKRRRERKKKSHKNMRYDIVLTM